MRWLSDCVRVLALVSAMASITFSLANAAHAFGADRSPAEAGAAAAGAAKAGHTKDDSRNRALDVRIQEILRRPEFRNARWGMKFYSPDANEVVYALNADQLFNPASAMKVFVAGTAFWALGADYRFHTSVYRTGPVENGVLRGDLVLVASGDLLLGGRVFRDGTLALPERDHTYDMSPGAVPVSADPLRSIHDLVEQIAAHGIRRVEGRVLVDASLFREAKGEAGGTGQVVISPIMINDNLVDVVVRPASRVGEAGSVRVAPETAYVKIINKTRTTAAAAGAAVVLMRTMGPGALQFTDDVTNADGSHTVNLTGDISLGSRPVLCAYRVPEPVRFAEMLLIEALRARGISARVDLLTRTDEGALAAFYRPENRVAELVSPPLSDEVKPMLKLSSNPQTLHFPYLVGAIAGHEKHNARQAGQEIQQKLFEKAGVSRGVKQGGELGMDRYSADAFITFLTYMSQQPWFARYLHALPILGKDGTVAKVQAGTPAAGHIYAKTGTGIWMTEPSDRGEVTKAAPSNRGEVKMAAPSKRGEMTIAAPSKRGEMTIAAPSKRGEMTIAAPSKRGEMTQIGPAGGLRSTFKGKPPQNGANLVKALAGYLELPDGRYIVFTEFLEMEGVRGLKGFDRFDQVMGEIASAVYESQTSR